LAATEAGKPVNLITPQTVGLHLYGDTIFTTGTEVREHPDMVRKFVQATVKGWQWAVDNPDRASSLALAYDSSLKLPHEQAEMTASIPSIAPDAQPIGSMESAAWTSLQDVLVAQGQMKAVDVSKAFTTQFLPGA